MLFDKYDAEAAQRVRDKEVAEEAAEKAAEEATKRTIAQERRKTLDAIKEMLRSGTTLELVTRAFNLTPDEEAYVTSDEA